MVVWDMVKLVPEVFGECDDPVAHGKRVEELRAKLADAQQRMRTSYGADDLLIDFAALSPDERRRGLAKVTFRIHPDVPLGAEDWPDRLVACEMRGQRAAA